MKIYYIATIILYALLTPLAATGIPVSLAEPEKVPFSVTVTAALLPPALLALSVVGLRKKWKIMRCLLWKVTVFFALGGCFFLGLGEAWPAFLALECAAPSGPVRRRLRRVGKAGLPVQRRVGVG